MTDTMAIEQRLRRQDMIFLGVVAIFCLDDVQLFFLSKVLPVVSIFDILFRSHVKRFSVNSA